MRSAAHDDAQVVRLALERVVVHREDLLVVVLAGDGVWDLVEVHQLIDEDEHALIAGAHEELREELEVVIPVIIADAAGDAELATGLGLGAVLAAEPPEDGGTALVIPLGAGLVISPQDAGEVEPVDHLLERGACCGEGCLRAGGGGINGGDPAIEHELERAALRTRLGREVANELAVGGETLPGGALEATLWREVCVRNDETLAHRVRADRLEQEALARAVATYEEAEAGTAVGDKVEVMEEGANFSLAADRYVGQADARHHATLERVDDDGSDALGHAWLGGGRISG